jgi:CheY-specific phosphatase CheX
MRQEFVNPFLTAAQHVFEVELGQELKFAGARATEDTITSEDITAFIGVTGRLEGNVFYGFKRAVARSIHA